LACDIEYASKNAFADGDRDWSAERAYFHAACETFGGTHSDRANPVFTEVLLHFECEILFFAADLEIDFERVVNFGQSTVCWAELDIDNGADDLNDSSFMIHVWLVSVKKGVVFSVRISGPQLHFDNLKK
jgi:hypothetical protein